MLSTDSDIVEYIAHCIFEISDLYKITDKNIAAIVSPETFKAKEFSFQNDNDDVSEIVLNGWIYDGFERIGKRKRISAEKWVRIVGNHVIYIVNESQYESVGDVRLSIVASSVEEIELFCRENNLELKFGIEECDTVQQTF